MLYKIKFLKVSISFVLFSVQINVCFGLQEISSTVFWKIFLKNDSVIPGP